MKTIHRKILVPAEVDANGLIDLLTVALFPGATATVDTHTLEAQVSVPSQWRLDLASWFRSPLPSFLLPRGPEFVRVVNPRHLPDSYRYGRARLCWTHGWDEDLGDEDVVEHVRNDLTNDAVLDSEEMRVATVPGKVIVSSSALDAASLSRWSAYIGIDEEVEVHRLAERSRTTIVSSADHF